MRRHLAVTGAVAAVLALGADAAVGVATADTGSADMHRQMTTTTIAMPHRGAMSGSMPMDTASMEAMHSAMRAAMPAEFRAACDAAHAAMTGTTTLTPDAASNHAAHHPNG